MEYFLYYIELALKQKYGQEIAHYAELEELFRQLSGAADIEEFGEILVDIDNLLCDITEY